MVNVFEKIEGKKKPKTNPFKSIDRAATRAKVSKAAKDVKILKGDLEATIMALNDKINEQDKRLDKQDTKIGKIKPNIVNNTIREEVDKQEIINEVKRIIPTPEDIASFVIIPELPVIELPEYKEPDDVVDLSTKNRTLILTKQSGETLRARIPTARGGRGGGGNAFRSITGDSGSFDAPNSQAGIILTGGRGITTAVSGNVATLTLDEPIVTRTSAYAATASDYSVVFDITTTALYTLPNPETNSGRELEVINKYTSSSEKTVTFSVPINGSENFGLLPGSNVTIRSDGTEYLINK